MKKIMFPAFAMIALTVFTLVGCSKDTADLAPVEAARSTSGRAAFNDQQDTGIGAITGVVTPVPAVMEITIVGDNGLKIQAKADVDGNFHVQDIPEGVYTVVISYLDSKTGQHTLRHVKIEHVKVLDGQTTDLGDINLQ